MPANGAQIRAGWAGWPLECHTRVDKQHLLVLVGRGHFAPRVKQDFNGRAEWRGVFGLFVAPLDERSTPCGIHVERADHGESTHHQPPEPATWTGGGRHVLAQSQKRP